MRFQLILLISAYSSLVAANAEDVAGIVPGNDQAQSAGSGPTVAKETIDPISAEVQAIENRFAHIEKELPNVNIFRLAGDWILRATSDLNYYHTRASIRLCQNQAKLTIYVEDDVLGNGTIAHAQNSKAVVSDFSLKGLPKPLFYHVLHFEPKLIIYVIDLPGVLNVITNSEEKVDEECIRKTIETKLLSNPVIRPAVKHLVQKLSFVNNDVPPMCYLKRLMPLSEEDIIDVDLSNAGIQTQTKSLSDWHMKASTPFAEGIRIPTRIQFNLNADQAIGCLFDQKNDQIGNVIIRPVKGSKTFDAILYEGVHSVRYLMAFLYSDPNFVVVYGYPTTANAVQTPVLSAWSVNEADSDIDYLKKLLDQYVLFNHDTKRVIKDLLPTLDWKSSQPTSA